MSSTRRAAPLAAALAAAGLLSTGCGEGTANAEPVPTLLDAGDEGDRITLPVPYAVGQTATTELTYDISFSIDILGSSETYSFAFDVLLAESVEEVDEDGGAVVHSTIEDLAVTDAPAELDTSTLDDLVGVTLVDHQNAQGASESIELLKEDELTAEQRAAAEEMFASASTATFAFPTESVGVGARWTGEESVASSGLEVPITYQYELVELTDETYAFEITIDSDVDAEVDGAQLTGAYTGHGTQTGDRRNPLAISSSLELSGDFDIEAEGETGSMEISISVALDTIESSSEPAATVTTG